MANSLVRINEFKSLLNDQTFKAQIKNSLKENAAAFLSSMIDLYSGDDYLQKCDPKDVVAECVKACSLKLPLVKSLGFAYVVPYKNKPTFTIGYKGLIQLAQRTGLYRFINADVVYEGELVKKDKLTGAIDLSGEKKSDAVIGYFAYIQTAAGFEKTFYMSKRESETWRDRYSPSATSNYSPWKTEFDKMAIKTVLRRLISVYGPMTTEMAQAIEMDSTPPEKVIDMVEQAEKSSLFEEENVIEGEIVGTEQQKLL